MKNPNANSLHIFDSIGPHSSLEGYIKMVASCRPNLVGHLLGRMVERMMERGMLSDSDLRDCDVLDPEEFTARKVRK